MKKTLVLVLSLLMVLSLASVASASLNIVGGQFSLDYTIDMNEAKPIDGSKTDALKGEARINLEGKYSNDNFVGYCYSRFDFNNDSVNGGAPRWYMKKAEMDYIIADGFTLGLAFDKDDIKIHDELVYDGKKLKDFYNGVVLLSAKYAGDDLKVSNFNTMFTGGLFDNLTVVKLDIADAKIRSLIGLNQAKAGGESYLGFKTFSEASYNFGDFEVGAGAELAKAAAKNAKFEISTIRGAVKAYLGSFTVTVRGQLGKKGDKMEFNYSRFIIGYDNYELDTVFEPKKKFEPKLKIKKLAGTNNDIEAKFTFSHDGNKFKKPKINVKHIFRF